MKLLTPSAGTPVSFSDIFQGFLSYFNQSNITFESVIKAYTNKKYCYFTNSGTTAFYIILKALKTISPENRGHPTCLHSALSDFTDQKAGLKPVLCDISLKTFNMDFQSLAKCINENTLCVVPVHMFGLPMNMEDVMQIAQQHSLFVVEDAASSLGTTIDNRPTGVFGVIGFYSFNRGKNLLPFQVDVLLLTGKRWQQRSKKNAPYCQNWDWFGIENRNEINCISPCRTPIFLYDIQRSYIPN